MIIREIKITLKPFMTANADCDLLDFRLETLVSYYIDNEKPVFFTSQEIVTQDHFRSLFERIIEKAKHQIKDIIYKKEQNEEKTI